MSMILMMRKMLDVGLLTDCLVIGLLQALDTEMYFFFKFQFFFSEKKNNVLQNGLGVLYKQKYKWNII